MNLELEEEKPETDFLEGLKSRWPEIEAVLESHGRNAKLDEALLDYLNDLKDDNSALRHMRVAILGFSGLAIVILWLALFYLILCRPLVFFWIGQNARVAFIAGLLAFSGLLLVASMKGAFRMMRERHDDSVPENIKLIAQTISTGKLNGDTKA